MAHSEQIAYCRSIKQRYPEYFHGKLVLDIGSLDINGNNQYLFDNCLYLGLDIGEGRNVDIVCKAHELLMPDATFDVIISTSTLEHDRYYPQTLQNAHRLLKPGGLILMTVAGEGHGEHGTAQTTPNDAPLLQTDVEWANYYKNLTSQDLRAVWDVDMLFQSYEFIYNPASLDLYFYGLKVGTFISRVDYSFLCRG